MSEGDAPRAESIFSQIREMDPDNPAVVGGLARALIDGGKKEDARALLDGLGEEQSSHPAVSRARAALEVAAAPAADVSAEEARLAADPDDHGARFAIAQARMAAGDRPRRQTHCWRSSPATGTGTTAQRARCSSRCLKLQGSRTPGPGPSGAGCRHCCLHDWAVHMMGSKPARILFPLAGAILFPRSQLPLHIFEPRYREMVRDALAGPGRIGMVQPNGAGEPPPLFRGMPGRDRRRRGAGRRSISCCMARTASG